MSFMQNLPGLENLNPEIFIQHVKDYIDLYLELTKHSTDDKDKVVGFIFTTVKTAPSIILALYNVYNVYNTVIIFFKRKKERKKAIDVFKKLSIKKKK